MEEAEFFVSTLVAAVGRSGGEEEGVVGCCGSEANDWVSFLSGRTSIHGQDVRR